MPTYTSSFEYRYIKLGFKYTKHKCSERLYRQAGCDESEVLDVTCSKSYDDKNNLLDEYDNREQKVFCSYNGVVDGEIYYWAICKED